MGLAQRAASDVSQITWQQPAEGNANNFAHATAAVATNSFGEFASALPDPHSPNANGPSPTLTEELRNSAGPGDP